MSEKEKQSEKDSLQIKKCLYCGKSHEGTYGSGKFCSKQCKIAYVANLNHTIKHPKVKKHLDDLRKKGLVSKRSTYGTWKCPLCSHIAETREQLLSHQLKTHNCQRLKTIKLKNSLYQCPFCQKQYQRKEQIAGHLTNCPNHPKRKEHDDAHKRGGEKYHTLIKNNQTNHPFKKGSKHSKISKEKISASTINRIYDANHTYRRKDVLYYNVKDLKGITRKVRGTWELLVAKTLNDMKIDWDNETYLKYKSDIIRTYHPDFHLTDSNIFIEVKGFYDPKSKEKMKCVLNSNPNVKIYILHKNFLDFKNHKKLLFDSLTLLNSNNVTNDDL